MAMFPLALLPALSLLDRTGRRGTGGPSDHVSASVKCASVQVGGLNKPNDVHARFEKDLCLGNLLTHFTARFRHPNPRDRLLDTVSLSGSLGDVYYEATRALGAASGETDLQLAYSLPSGVQLMADAKADDKAAWRLDRLSAFHVAGPFNVEPAFLPPSRVFRLKLARGGRWNRCPFSVQTDLPTDGVTPPSYDLGMRHEFDDAGERKLRAHLLLPGQARARQMWAEYQDAQIDKGGIWIAKALLPLGATSGAADDGAGAARELVRKAEFSLRRTWMW